MTTIWRVLGDALALFPRADLRCVAAGLGIDVVVLLMMGWRWRGLLTALGVSVDWCGVLLISAAGNAVTNVTPARSVGGDTFRVVSVRTRTGASLRIATASVFYDRLAELCGFSVLLALGAPRLATLTHPTTVVIGAFLGIAVCAMPPVRRALVARWLQWHHRLVGVSLAGRDAGIAVAWAMVVWLLDVVRVVIVGRAFGADIPVSLAATVSLARLVSGAAPVPAGIGVVDGALVATLLWGGVSADVATATALLEHAIVYGWATLLGVLALAWLGGRRVLAVVSDRRPASRDAVIDDGPLGRAGLLARCHSSPAAPCHDTSDATGGSASATVPATPARTTAPHNDAATPDT